MTGPEHYKAAEAMVKEASKDGKSQAGVTALLARAQVHATLALAAATIFDTRLDSTSDAWCVVTGTLRSAPKVTP